MAQRKGQFRGVDNRHEMHPAGFRRDTRRLSLRFAETFRQYEFLAFAIFVMVAMTIALPWMADLLLLATFHLFFKWSKSVRVSELPFRMPIQAKRKDYGDLAPGSYKPRTARGIFFLGNDLATNEEIWLDNDYLRRHLLLIGTTGAGKSEALKGMAANALSWGSGFIGVDGKADTSLVASFLSLVHSFRREDDVLILNFMTGGRDIRDASEAQSNTLNPLTHGSTAELQELFASLMSESGSGSSGDMWKDRAKAMNDALLFPLVYLRDQGEIELSVGLLRKYMELPRMIELATRHDIPASARDPLMSYLVSIPGFDITKGAKQESTALDQHGYLVMQFTRILGSLNDTYGHIFRVDLGDVDFYDIVVNRRILLVLLPALEKSPAELANLGKIVVASIKNMMAKALGSQLEGDRSEIIESKPTNSDTPIFTFLDEVGYYMTPGMAVMPAQGRSLGFSFTFAAQDVPGLYRGGKEEALSILGNTATWIVGKVRDVEETKKMVEHAAGEIQTTQVSGFSMQPGGMTRTYSDRGDASIQKESRIDWRDIQDQKEGEVHILLESKIIRGATLYVEPEPLQKLRINRFLRVHAPSGEALSFDARLVAEVLGHLKDPDFTMVEDAPAQENPHAAALDIMERRRDLIPADRACAAVASMVEANATTSDWDIDDFAPGAPVFEPAPEDSQGRAAQSDATASPPASPQMLVDRLRALGRGDGPPVAPAGDSPGTDGALAGSEMAPPPTEQEFLPPASAKTVAEAEQYPAEIPPAAPARTDAGPANETQGEATRQDESLPDRSTGRHVVDAADFSQLQSAMMHQISVIRSAVGDIFAGWRGAGQGAASVTLTPERALERHGLPAVIAESDIVPVRTAIADIEERTGRRSREEARDRAAKVVDNVNAVSTEYPEGLEPRQIRVDQLQQALTRLHGVAGNPTPD